MCCIIVSYLLCLYYLFIVIVIFIVFLFLLFCGPKAHWAFFFPKAHNLITRPHDLHAGPNQRLCTSRPTWPFSPRAHLLPRPLQHGSISHARPSGHSWPCSYPRFQLRFPLCFLSFLFAWLFSFCSLQHAMVLTRQDLELHEPHAYTVTILEPPVGSQPP